MPNSISTERTPSTPATCFMVMTNKLAPELSRRKVTVWQALKSVEEVKKTKNVRLREEDEERRCSKIRDAVAWVTSLKIRWAVAPRTHPLDESRHRLDSRDVKRTPSERPPTCWSDFFVNALNDVRFPRARRTH
ncbi:unnamed protein product [Heligmosomoides polygyrus]|uniref:Uncharacterized protein n=1 Tax=Heligmosomoides polygyrus TaxID=6339 RepID=A0A183GWP4_HELPZ|nr:unnamed protein product [Heligmosomoides polygyrus]